MIGFLFDHLWQSCLFAGAAGLLTLVLHRNGAGVRFWLWTAASVKFLLPFAALTLLSGLVLAPLTPPLQAPVLMRMQPLAQPFSGVDPVLVMPDAAVAPVAAHFDPALLLLALWAVGFTTLLLRWFLRWSNLRSLLRHAADLDIGAPIGVKSSFSRIEPGLVGIVRPVILLPQGIEGRLSPAELGAILAHELAHWRRRDNLWAALHMLVEALFWFFPLVWWLGARLNEERERACDESVLAAGGNPAIYAEGILKVCRLYLQTRLACAAGVSGGGLKIRVDAILDNHFLPRLTMARKSLLAMCAILAVGAPLALGLLTAPSNALAPAEAPHPGTEAALRRQIEGWERRQPRLEEMTAPFAAQMRQQQAVFQAVIDKGGPLKAITFKETDTSGFDLYLVQFAHGASIWAVAPLLGGKIQSMGFAPVEPRTDKGPSPGLADAARRLYESVRAGAPAYDLMGPQLIAVTHQQLAGLETDAGNLGALKSLTFVRINAMGWDVYAARFEKGTSIFTAAPLAGGKVTNIQWADMEIPGARAHPGTQESVRRYIESLEKGQPNYNEMLPAQAAGVKQLLPDLLAMTRQLGALKSITFHGVGHAGMDAYDVSFAHGKAIWNIGPLTPDGKVARRNFQLLQ